MAPAIPVEEDVADLLHALNRRIRSAARRALEPIGVTPAQARALRVIERATSNEQTMRMSEVAARLGIAPRSATSVVDELSQHELVTRSADPTDRRAVVVELTDAGRSTVAALRDQRRAVASRLVGRLPRRDLLVLRDLLRRLDEAGEPDDRP